MGWAKFDDQYTDHPKVVAAGPWAELLDMRAVIHCARYETDGHISAAQLPKLALGIPAPKKKAQALVDAGRWVATDDGWWVHDFLDYHPSREQKEKEREDARERMAKNRANKGRNTGRSSQDVRPNNGRSSDYPDPAPPVVPNGTTPPGGNGEPFVRRLADELRADHGFDPQHGGTVYDSFHELLTFALERLPEGRHHDTTMGVIADFVERVQGFGLTNEARSHTARLVRNHPPSAVLYGFGQALDWGAGTTAEYAESPVALSRYVTGVLGGRKRGAA